jgi:hypothetical protein
VCANDEQVCTVCASRANDLMCRFSSDEHRFGFHARPARSSGEPRNLSFRPLPILGFHPL